MKKIWIDLDNSPHVPFFQPIIKMLKQKQYVVEVTARKCFQVCELADLFNLKYRSVGKHYGKNIVLKTVGTMIRAIELLAIAAKAKPAVALSHGSRSMLIAASILRIPAIEIMDYEFTIDVPMARPALLIIPEVVARGYRPPTGIKVMSYPGIKEDVYVPFFEPDHLILSELALKDDQIIATLRPPATEAHYHNSESDILFDAVIDMLGACEKVRIVILPRNRKTEIPTIVGKWKHLMDAGRLIIPDRALDGLNLIWHSDLVISGGGTVNREAAALGVPAFSIFKGKIGEVDKYLAAIGRLCLIKSKEDVKTKIKLLKRDKISKDVGRTNYALDSIVKSIETFMHIEGMACRWVAHPPLTKSCKADSGNDARIGSSQNTVMKIERGTNSADVNRPKTG